MATIDEKTQIHNRIYPLVSSLAGGDYYISDVIYAVDQLMDLRAHRLFKNNSLINYLEQLTTLYAYHADGNIIKNPKIQEQELEFRKSIISEYERLNLDN